MRVCMKKTCGFRPTRDVSLSERSTEPISPPSNAGALAQKLLFLKCGERSLIGVRIFCRRSERRMRNFGTKRDIASQRSILSIPFSNFRRT